MTCFIPSTGGGRDHGSRRGAMRVLGQGVVLLCACVALAACQQTRLAALPDDGYRTRHPIVLKEVPHTLDVPVGLTTSRIDTVQRDRIAGFAREAGERGDGALDILVPSGSANEATAYSMASRIRRIVGRSGIAPHNINLQAYAVADPKAVAPIRLAYAAIRAAVHRCGVWPDNIAGNFNRNEDYWEFGCASQGNLAAMVSNPSDLLHPRTSTPADQERRSTVFDKYRRGEATASEPEQGDATVANVGGS